MTEPAKPEPKAEPNAAPEANAGLVLATEEDMRWARKLEKKIARTLSPLRAKARAADALLAAIGNKQLWRVNHILVSEFSRPLFLPSLKIKASEPIPALYDALLAKGEKLRDYPALAKRNDTPLEAAVKAGWTEGARLLLERGGNTGDALYYALASNQRPVLELVAARAPELLSRPVAARFVDKDAFSDPRIANDPLGVSLRHGAPQETFEFLLERRKDKPLDPLLLRYALKMHKARAAVQLVEAGVPPGDPTKPDSALSFAVASGLAEVVEKIIDRGIDPQVQAKAGAVLLAQAVARYGQNGVFQDERKGLEKIVPLLLKRLPPPADELREMLSRLSPKSPFFETLKMTVLAADLPPGADPAWRVMGPEQVASVARDDATGTFVTELFNFATQEHLILSRHPETKVDALLLRETFAEAKNEAAVEQARTHLAPKPAAAAPVNSGPAPDKP